MPPRPIGCSRLCAGPAPKPSAEMLKQLIRRRDIGSILLQTQRVRCCQNRRPHCASRGAPAMARIESKLAALGLVLPAPMQVPPGVVLPFAMVRIVGRRALVSGHGPLAADGSLAHPLGKVG